MPSLLHAAAISAPVTVAVIRDDAAASFYDTPAVLDSIVESWRLALTKNPAGSATYVKKRRTWRHHLTRSGAEGQ